MEPGTSRGRSRSSRRHRGTALTSTVQCPSHCPAHSIPRDVLLDHLAVRHALRARTVLEPKFRARICYLRPNIGSDGSLDRAWSWIAKVVRYEGRVFLVHAGALTETNSIQMWISVFTEDPDPPTEPQSSCRIRLMSRRGATRDPRKDTYVTAYVWTGPIWPTNFGGEPVPQFSVPGRDMGDFFKYEQDSTRYPGQYLNSYWNIEVELRVSEPLEDRFLWGLSTIQEEDETPFLEEDEEVKPLALTADAGSTLEGTKGPELSGKAKEERRTEREKTHRGGGVFPLPRCAAALVRPESESSSDSEDDVWDPEKKPEAGYYAALFKATQLEELEELPPYAVLPRRRRKHRAHRPKK